MGYAWAVGAATACTLLGLAISPRFELVNSAMLYLLAIVAMALRYGRGPVAVTSILCVAAFDFFFVPPKGTFTVHDPQYWLTFGMMLAVGLIISTLTETVRKREKARAQLALEAETERIRSALLASISHDLRTPLAIMTGASSSLAERGEQLSAQERGALARSVYERSHEMSELVDKVLQMTRLESGSIQPARDWVSLGEISSAVIRRLGERLSSHMIMAEVPDDLPLVRVDAALIEQVFVNLLENAVRHTPTGTLVRIRGQIDGDDLVVSVEDLGGGLGEADTRNLFAKFQRRSERRGGVGLGLAICQAIVKLHGGRIWAEPLPGGGKAFRFNVRMDEVPEAPAATADA